VRGGTVEIRGDREVREHYVVVLDPGHGGWDPGAVGISGTREADIALSLSRRIAVELERLLDVEVILTRDDNTFIPLVERANIANSLNADLFVSVHANASDRESAWGIETYYLDGASDAGAARVAARENALAEEGDDPTSIVSDLNVTGTNRLSQSLAVTIQTEVVRAITETFGPTHTRDLGVKSALFAVLVWSRMPSVLFESSFVTNRVDETRLRLPYYQQTQAEAIATAIQSWFDSVER
jgi:N-acetylmuramoyl-L-alanine amidase